MDVLAQLDQLGPVVGRVVGGISPHQLDRPTPCTEFTVAGVLGHMIVGATIFTAAYRGEELPPPPDVVDPLTQFGEALTGLDAAIRAPGAFDRTLATPFGDMTGQEFARYIVFDGLVHGWDMATATGQAYDPPDALVAEADAYAHGLLPHARGPAFAEATEPPSSATPIERLAAYSGRRV